MPKLIVDIGISNADVCWRPPRRLCDGGEGRVEADDVTSSLDLRCELAGELVPMLVLTGEVGAETRNCRMLGVSGTMEWIVKVLDTKLWCWGR